MNAVEIEEAISELALQPFDAESFPYEFLIAMGNKPTTIKRLKTGSTNKSDIGGVLQTSNIHISIAETGKVTETLAALKVSPATSRTKAKYVLATDGVDFEAEQLQTGETVACEYEKFPDHFGFFLPLAGITTVKEISENAFDIKATSRLNKLYVELLKDNPEWTKDERREDMNHFMARLIFCFFAEDTNIFKATDLFTRTVEQMSTRDASNTHEIIAEVFRAMNVDRADRDSAGISRWAKDFPYVNGGLFDGNEDVPRFSKIARSYLLHVGNLDWTKINPDIFGSMIQAVADEEERGELGMHYTSVPNILKVLNPLFLDELRKQLDQAGNNPRKLLNLRKRIARIRVFDPACGSGNFLVIAYKQLREIEYEINKRREEVTSKTVIPLTNFRGIELRHFSAEIARLALIIAEYQCDVEYLGQQQALQEFLPLQDNNWITCGNALRLDWLSICPPTGTSAKLVGDDLFETPLNQAEIDFENEGGQTFICGNPPYLGSTWQSQEQKEDLRRIFEGRTKGWKSLDYVAGWFMKAADYGKLTPTISALVSTNSICQGQQVPILWPLIFDSNHSIAFAHTSFRWSNLATHNAGVTVVIVAISNLITPQRQLFQEDNSSKPLVKNVANINPYLIGANNIIVFPRSRAADGRGLMVWGNKPTDGGNLFLDSDQKRELLMRSPKAAKFVKRFLGAKEFVRGEQRYCLWITDTERAEAEGIKEIAIRLKSVAEMRASSKAAETRPAADYPHRFRQIQGVAKDYTLVVGRVTSENRDFLPIGLEDSNTIIGDRNFALYDAPLWNMALIASRLHWVWIGTVCVRLRTDFSYSNTLGWNTFPLPSLTEKNKADLAACAENILLAREAHFPATIADLYDPENMPDNLRAAHERNDEVLERIYIGRRFKNDTERLEKLFELYTKMTSNKSVA